MKIALIVHDLQQNGGHSLYTKILADELSRRHEVGVFANRCERRTDARWTPHYVRAWRINALSCVQTFPLGIRSQNRLLKGYDIRHTQGYCGGDPNVVTAHICVAAYIASLRGVSLRHHLSLRMMAAAEARLYRRFRGRVIAVSQKVAGELQRFYGVHTPITVIPHGVDPARFNGENSGRFRKSMREELGVSTGETLALYIGDLTKAHSYLKELSSAAPKIRFVIVTSSTAYHWQSPNVRILRATAEIERFYAAADAFVFPTTYDAFGMVLLEAMASGLPVISSDCAGAAALIESGVDGFVSPLAEWVETAAMTLRDSAGLRKVGRSAGQTARRHNWPSVVSAVEQVYGQVNA